MFTFAASRRLALRLALFAFLITILWTILGAGSYVYLNYTHEKQGIDRRLTELLATHSDSIAKALWGYNTTLIQSQLEGIIQLPFISSVSVQSQDLFLKAGSLTTNDDPCRTAPLIYRHKGEDIQLGTLTICVNYAPLYGNMRTSAYRILLHQSLSAFTITLAIFFLFYFMVGRHLENLSHQARTLTTETLDQPITIARPRGKEHDHDELGVLVSALDGMRTNLKTTILDLKASEAQYRKLFETMHQGVVYHDASGQIISANPASLRILGITMDQLMGKTSLAPRWKSIHEDGTAFPGEEHPAIRAMETGTRITDVVMGVFNPTMEEYRWILINAIPLFRDGDDRPHQVHVTFEDITDRKQLQDVMIQSEKMMSLGGLAAGMAHEINNPLAALSGYLHNIRKRTMSDLDANRTVAVKHQVSLEGLRGYLKERGIPEMLEGALESVNRAAVIVRNMLQFSRKSESRFDQHDIVDLLEKTLELVGSDYDLGKRYDFKKIQIIREYQPDLPPVLCEGNEIQQVFFNIFKNCAEAMADKEYGNDVPTFILRVRLQDASMRIEIEDNGPGMVEQVRKRAFEPFFTTRPVGSGTGLGLSVSYFIVTDLHKGSMDVQSVPNSWTRFTIRLPLPNSPV